MGDGSPSLTTKYHAAKLAKLQPLPTAEYFIFLNAPLHLNPEKSETTSSVRVLLYIGGK